MKISSSKRYLFFFLIIIFGNVVFFIFVSYLRSKYEENSIAVNSPKLHVYTFFGKKLIGDSVFFKNKKRKKFLKTIEDKSEFYSKILSSLNFSANSNNINLYLEKKETFNGFYDEMFYFSKFLENLDDGDIAMCINFDIMFFCKEEEILRLFRWFNSKIVLSAQLGFFPRDVENEIDEIEGVVDVKKHILKLYEEINKAYVKKYNISPLKSKKGQYNYLNGGMIMGNVKYLKENFVDKFLDCLKRYDRHQFCLQILFSRDPGNIAIDRRKKIITGVGYSVARIDGTSRASVLPNYNANLGRKTCIVHFYGMSKKQQILVHEELLKNPKTSLKIFVDRRKNAKVKKRITTIKIKPDGKSVDISPE